MLKIVTFAMMAIWLFAPQDVAIRIEPAAAIVDTEMTQKFQAVLTGTSDRRMIWEVRGGQITNDGLYTAPREPGNYSVTVFSIADPGKRATVRIAVRLPTLSVVCDDQANCTVLGLRSKETYRVTVETDTRKNSIEEVAP